MSSTTPIILTTYDWVPDMPRGHVRDLRILWLLEEIGRPYAVETVPLRDKTEEHLARQPFHQVPMIRDGDLSLFESGAILLYLAEGTDLMPSGDDHARTTQWLIAALNSIETFAMGWAISKFFEKDEATVWPSCKPRLRGGPGWSASASPSPICSWPKSCASPRNPACWTICMGFPPIWNAASRARPSPRP
jgi:hypothetical protein